MNILALQGGGTHGKGQVVALLSLELATKAPLCATFSSVGGTSVGSIIGAAVAIGLPMKAVNGFFDKSAPEIFARGIFTPIRQMWGPKYSPYALESALQNLLGNFTLSDCHIPFVACAFDVASGRNVYFQSYGKSHADSQEIVIAPDTHPNLPLWQICRASAAAQTYFPAFIIDDMVLIDGGNTGCNAPDMLCLTEALNAGHALSDIKMLSIGGGRTAWTADGDAMINPSIIRAALATINVVFAGGENNAVWQAESLLRGNHYRLESDLGQGLAIDDASPNALDLMTTAMCLQMNNHPELLGAFSPQG